MSLRVLPAVVFLVLAGGRAPAEPPVTSPDRPSPKAEVERLWARATREAKTATDDGRPRSELVRMLLAVQRDEKLAPGVGWYGPAQRRHDWTWLAGRYDADRDGRITPAEFTGPRAFFGRLDRDQDGAVRAADFDWSERSAWVRQDAQALKLLRAVDQDGDGRLTEAEWLAHFRKRAAGRDHLTADDLRDTVAALNAEGGKAGGGKQRRVSREKWVECLKAGDLGSPFPGPGVGETAPDFTLPLHQGGGTVTLSQFRGHKPVVLIFGSFT